MKDKTNPNPDPNPNPNEDPNGEFLTVLDKIGINRAINEQSFVFPAPKPVTGIATNLESLDKLIERDKQRVDDGFPSKIRFRRILVGPGKVIRIPYVVEGGLHHGDFEPKLAVDLCSLNLEEIDDDIETIPGSGDGDVGDVIGEVPLPLGGDGDDDGDDGDDGDGDDPKPGDETADHEFEEEAYEIGKELMNEFELPNLTEKKKRFPTDEYTYELTDRHRGSGQVLDRLHTLGLVVKTNLVLGTVNEDDMDPTKMIVAPRDRSYRVLSKERVWKSQAVVMFLRDYSGSTWGEITDAIVSQHLMIYSWLLVQYEKRVIPRFFVHDTECHEVTAREYFGLNARGGTMIVSGYKKINDVVSGEGLDEEYDIFVFQGTDGDDWDSRGLQTIPELKKILKYVRRMGVTLFESPYYVYYERETTFEGYIKAAEIQKNYSDKFRMHKMTSQGVTEEMNIEAIKILIAED